MTAAVAATPLPGVADAHAIHVVCIGEGSAAAAGLAERACAITVDALQAAGRSEVSAVRVGDERTGLPGRLIVGVRLDVQPASTALPPLVVITGQTLRPEAAGGRVVPVAAHTVALTDLLGDHGLRAALAALLRDLGLT